MFRVRGGTGCSLREQFWSFGDDGGRQARAIGSAGGSTDRVVSVRGGGAEIGDDRQARLTMGLVGWSRSEEVGGDGWMALKDSRSRGSFLTL